MTLTPKQREMVAAMHVGDGICECCPPFKTVRVGQATFSRRTAIALLNKEIITSFLPYRANYNNCDYYELASYASGKERP